jgi:hypothetical protein
VKPPNETADPETARRTGDDDDLLQDVVLSGSNGAAFTQSLKIFWSEASLGLRRGVVVGKIGMATSHLAVER